MSEPDRAEFELSDEQWQTIATPVSLPDAARSQVEWAIARFRDFEDSDSSYRPRKALKRVQKKITKLLDALAALDAEALRAMRLDSSATGQLVHGLSTVRLLERLRNHADNIEQLGAWVDAAMKGVPRKSTRDSSNFHWLVGKLDDILYEHTQRHVSRSSKRDRDGPQRFVEAVAAVACPASGYSITEAIKAATKKRAAPRTRLGEISDSKLRAQSRQ
jgi:hypothetical protein